jgi:hypothetical protein
VGYLPADAAMNANNWFSDSATAPGDSYRTGLGGTMGGPFTFQRSTTAELDFLLRRYRLLKQRGYHQHCERQPPVS